MAALLAVAQVVLAVILALEAKVTAQLMALLAAEAAVVVVLTRKIAVTDTRAQVAALVFLVKARVGRVALVVAILFLARLEGAREVPVVLMAEIQRRVSLLALVDCMAAAVAQHLVLVAKVVVARFASSGRAAHARSHQPAQGINNA